MNDADLTRTGFYTAVSELIDDGYEVDDAVLSVLDNPDYRKSVVAAVSARFRSRMRTETRKQERSAVVSLRNRNFTGAKSALINRTFGLSDGRFVEWTKATKEDHLDRAEWFRGRARAFDETAQLHEIAARLIEDAGVKCLGQIKSIENWPAIAAMLEVGPGEN